MEMLLRWLLETSKGNINLSTTEKNWHRKKPAGVHENENLLRRAEYNRRRRMHH